MADELPAERREQINDELFTGRKIGAIKLYRAATGVGLAEAKEAVEAIEAQLRETAPERFTRRSGSGCGTAVVAFSFVLLGVAALLARLE